MVTIIQVTERQIKFVSKFNTYFAVLPGHNEELPDHPAALADKLLDQLWSRHSEKINHEGLHVDGGKCNPNDPNGWICVCVRLKKYWVQ